MKMFDVMTRIVTKYKNNCIFKTGFEVLIVGQVKLYAVRSVKVIHYFNSLEINPIAFIPLN